MKKTSLLSALLCSTLLTACGIGDWLGDKKERPPLPGERISVLNFEKDLRPDESAPATPFNAGEMAQSGWPQAGGDPSHMMPNLAFTTKQAQKIWSAHIGEGAKKNLPLTAQPVIAGKSIFTLDTEAQLASFDIDTGKRRWSVDVSDPEENDPVISGGIATDSGFVYVTAGYDEIVCVDGQNGQVKWRSKLSSPSRAAPTISGGRVFVTTLSNSILAFEASTGTVLWEFAGLGQSTGLMGAASPAAKDDIVIPAFSSGEIYALRAGNGSVAWSDNLSGGLKLGGISALSDVRGLPVIDQNVVYAISFGGKMVAVDMLTGARVWQKDISGSKTPWVASNRVFVISSEGQIISLDKSNGAVLWVSQLARFENREKRTGPITWSGPLLAGGRLMAFSSDGRIAEINPDNGTLVREWRNGESMSLSPIIAGGTLYVLSNDGDLIAYR